MIENINCLDKTVNGIANDVDFEKILSILDFPLEILEGDGLYGDWDANKSTCFGPIPLDTLMGLAPTPRGKICHASLLKSIAPTLEINGTHEQKALTCIEDTSNLSILNLNKSDDTKESGTFQTQSPSSALESNGSYSVEKGLIFKSDIVIRRRTRSRRRKSRTTCSWILTPSISTAVSASKRSPGSRKNKEAKRKKSSQMPVAVESINKKCTHCEVTETPQWREGPMGPRTLCNACGVRYRSGRLFPEYAGRRSGCKLPSLHSNSHKKIVEMRNGGKQPVMEVEDLWDLQE
ncbi:unnamed protein product [Fraxinus pennsylvanica]|uniref:GATA-type domain-containing protein n=1 Tax=Fraxinus pennsylvanica TaxID=56036 RepID=A0AAD1ZET9_9LAMI|nr:unnamed protein product [Fraxinus pennsylvanica]